MGKFKTILFLSVFLIAGILGGHTPALADQSKVVLVGGGQAYKALDDFLLEGELVGAVAGDSWYVDSGKSASGDGKSWDYAVITMNEAVDLATENNGDVVHVAPGHAENLSAANAIDLDTAGVRYVGYGVSGTRPTFTYTAAAGEFVIGAANITVENMRFLAAITDVLMGISVEAGGDNFTLLNSVFPEPVAGASEFLDMIDLASGADGVSILYNKAYSVDAAGAAHFVEAGNGVNSDLTIKGNKVFGDFSVAIVWSDTIDLEVLIEDNIFTNTNDGQLAIEFIAAATGFIQGNAVNSDSYGIDPGAMMADNVTPLQQLWLTKNGYTAGQGHPIAFWYVDCNATSGDGKSPGAAFKTITEAITASDNSVEDFIFVFDYSGSSCSAGTIAVNKSWVHILGRIGSLQPYPRVAPTTGHGFTITGNRVEIAGFTIGAQSTKAGIGIDSGSPWGLHIHDNTFGAGAGSASQEGIYTAAGADAPNLLVENNRFMRSITQEGIQITTNATRGVIRNNSFINLTASVAYPAIDIMNGGTDMQITDNLIFGGTDDDAGWAITMSAVTGLAWLNGNVAADDSATAASFPPFLDLGSANAWGINYEDITLTLPDTTQ